MNFVKMHGCGNDYIFVREEDIEGYERAELARKMSNRKSGVGSDGLIILCKSDCADMRMEMYNADGSRGRMCGNGIRCLCKYAYERKITIKMRLRIETDAGIREASLTCQGRKVIGVRVNMGRPSFEAKDIPVICDCARMIDEEFAAGGKTYRITCVNVGNPHAVIFVKNVNDAPVEEIGKKIEYHLSFPERVNVEFVQILDNSHMKMRVWERGSGETLACGTGACASLMSAYINHRCHRSAEVAMRGGILHVTYNEAEENVYLYGDAHEVFSGKADLSACRT